MLAGLSAYELAEWMAYFEAEPWGEERADLRSGIIASTLANVNRARDTPPYSPRDFMPYSRADQHITEDEIARRLDNFMRVYH